LVGPENVLLGKAFFGIFGYIISAKCDFAFLGGVIGKVDAENLIKLAVEFLTIS